MVDYPKFISSARARAAMEAHTNINLLGVMMALCENSLTYGKRMHDFERKIVRLCQMEAKAQLRIMDKATGRGDKWETPAPQDTNGAD